MLSSNSQVAVIIINYQRYQNIQNIINSLHSQNLELSIYCWNNGNPTVVFEGVESKISSSTNMYCWPRWFFAAQISCPYTLIMDDDIMPTDSNVIQSMINIKKKFNSDNIIVGAEGVLLKNNCPYFPTYSGRINRKSNDIEEKSSIHFKDVLDDQFVHIVKGRCMLVSTNSIRNLPLWAPHCSHCDDIVVSAYLGSKQPIHIVPSVLTERFENLPNMNGPMALSKKSNWKSIREKACNHYFDSI